MVSKEQLIADSHTTREIVEALSRTFGLHAKAMNIQIRPMEITIIVHAKQEIIVPDGPVSLRWEDGRVTLL